MKLVYLGTSAACPTLKRGLSSTVLVLERESIMVDCGEGTQFRYLQAGLRWNKPMTILLTHLHSDHCMGIFGLLQTMELQGRTEPVNIYGPQGTLDFINGIVKNISLAFSFKVTVNRVKNNFFIAGDDYTIYCRRSRHQVESFAYLFVEYNKPGHLDVEKAIELGVPDGPMMGDLKKGQDVVVERDGVIKVVRSAEVVSPSRKGVRIGFSGDTRPTQALKDFFTDCDYLTFESTFLKDEEALARKAKHSTAEEAATLAANANVRKLYLNHFSARHASDKLYMDEAFPIFPNVQCTKDLMEVKING